MVTRLGRSSGSMRHLGLAVFDSHLDFQAIRNPRDSISAGAIGRRQPYPGSPACGSDDAGGSGPGRTIVKNLRDKLGEDAENPTCTFN